METFALHPRRWQIVRVFGRNPLIRVSDRIEAAMLALTLAVSVAALPVAGAVGTAVHDAHAKTYAQQAQTRHRIAAVAVQDGTATVRPFGVTFTVEARWHTADGDHSAALPWDRAVKAGDRLDIWADDAGNHVAAPEPTSRAAIDAVSTGVAVWLWVTAGAAALFSLVRVLLDLRRSAAWEDEIGHLADDGGGRTSSQP